MKLNVPHMWIKYWSEWFQYKTFINSYYKSRNEELILGNEMCWFVEWSLLSLPLQFTCPFVDLVPVQSKNVVMHCRWCSWQHCSTFWAPVDDCTNLWTWSPTSAPTWETGIYIYLICCILQQLWNALFGGFSTFAPMKSCRWSWTTDLVYLSWNVIISV
jgi:hypothetical protein